MLTKILATLLGLAVVVVLLFIGLSIYSRSAPPLRSVEGVLPPCPDSPNCVSSENAGGEHSIAPISYSGSPLVAWERMTEVVIEAGGEVLQEDPGYLRAAFTTPVFRFVDDLELRLDERAGAIQVRSASRVGYSDRGANRQRVEMLRQRFAESANQP